MAQEKEELAYGEIVRLILENHFKPGDFLLETELAQDLNLSRTPVRHALSQLVAEGILDKKKKKGCFIPAVSPEDARHVFFAREHMEGLAATSAARYASEEDIQYLWRLIHREKGGEGPLSKMDYVHINRSFHMGIARFSRNKYLEQYSRHSFWRSHTYIFFFDKYYTDAMASGGQETGPRQHIGIVEAIENRNEEKAGNLMRQHIRTTFEQLFVKL